MARKRRRPDDFDVIAYVESFGFVKDEEKPRLLAAMSTAWRKMTGRWPGIIPVLEYRAMVRHRLAHPDERAMDPLDVEVDEGVKWRAAFDDAPEEATQ